MPGEVVGVSGALGHAPGLVTGVTAEEPDKGVCSMGITVVACAAQPRAVTSIGRHVRGGRPAGSWCIGTVHLAHKVAGAGWLAVAVGRGVF